MNKAYYQNVLFTLSNGETVFTIVPAFCDGCQEISVTNVQVTEPIRLPEGIYWGNHDEEETESQN